MNREEIRTVSEFNQILKGQKGFILITDYKKRSKIHRVKCPKLLRKCFIEKVLFNKKKNGGYYWIACGERSLRKQAWNRCRYCFPER